MATAASVKAKIIGLIDKSNATTGNTDTDLTTAVDALVDGYGKGGETVETQEKTVDITENGTTEVLPDAGFALSKVTVNTNVASVGDVPKLNAPTLNLALSNLLIEAADNGSFDDGYRLYIDGEQVAELAITTTTVDLTTYISEEGDYTISVVCYGDGFEDSDEASVTFSYVLRGVSYYGAIDPISPARAEQKAASIKDELVIFTGTYYNYDMDVYDRELTRTGSQDGLPYGNPAASSIGEYAVMAGGRHKSPSGSVYSYNSELTKTSCSSLDVGMIVLHSANVGSEYVLICGGRGADSTLTDIVNVYDSSMTKHASVALSVARHSPLAASTPNHALFVGGLTTSLYNSQTKVIDAFDTELTRTSFEHSAVIANAYFSDVTDGAGEIGNYAIFVYGLQYNSQSEGNQNFAYDDDMTKITFTRPSYDVSGEIITVGDYAIVPTYYPDDDFCVYDIALTQTTVPRPLAGYGFRGASIGEYAIYSSLARDGSSWKTATTDVYLVK